MPMQHFLCVVLIRPFNDYLRATPSRQPCLAAPLHPVAERNGETRAAYNEQPVC